MQANKMLTIKAKVRRLCVFLFVRFAVHERWNAPAARSSVASNCACVAAIASMLRPAWVCCVIGQKNGEARAPGRAWDAPWRGVVAHGAGGHRWHARAPPCGLAVFLSLFVAFASPFSLRRSPNLTVWLPEGQARRDPSRVHPGAVHVRGVPDEDGRAVWPAAGRLQAQV